ncbi:MAG: hypothetical protein ACX930_01405 [Erythrobacter sp.]
MTSIHEVAHMIDDTDTHSALTPSLRRILIAMVGVPLLIIGAGFMTGYASAALSHGTPSGIDVAVLLGMSAILVLIAIAGWKFWPRQTGEPVADSTRKSLRLLYIAIAIGVGLGFFFAISEDMSGSALFSNEPVAPAVAAVGLTVWLITLPWLTWVWWRSVDEHEAAAYSQGALFAGHAYVILAPSWWLASRAGWLPAQEPMIVFAIIISLWSGIWVYKRFS